jgi:predicted N-acyltransferase
MTALRASAGLARDQVVTVGAADRIEPRQWDRLAHRGFHLHHWFVAAEQSGWKPRHWGVQGAQGLRTIVPAYLTGANAPHDLHDRWLGPLRDVSSRVGLNLRPVLSVQPPFSLISEPLGDFESLASSTLHDIFSALEETAREERAKAVVWPFVDAWQYRLIGVARERGYAVFHSGVTAVLRVRWLSFGEYLESRSKSVRRTIRGELASISAAGIRATLTSDFQAEAVAMDMLYREGFRRRNGREAPVSPHFFRKLARTPIQSVRALLSWYGDRLVGTSLNLVTPQLMDGTFAAFGRQHHRGPVFYNDLCYEPLRHAIAERIEAIDLGASALYAKVLRGAVLQRRVVLIRGSSAAGHRALSALGGLVARRTEQKERESLGPLWGPRCFEEEA